MEMPRRAVALDEQANQIFGDVHRFDRADAQAFHDRRFIQDAAKRVAQVSSRAEVAPIISQINSTRYDFTRATKRKFANLLDHAARVQAAAASSHLRNHTKRAPAVATITNFQHRPRVTRLAAFNGRDQQFPVLQHIPGKNFRRERSRKLLGSEQLNGTNPPSMRGDETGVISATISSIKRGDFRLVRMPTTHATPFSAASSSGARWA